MGINHLIGQILFKDAQAPVLFEQDPISYPEAETILDDYQRLKTSRHRKKWISKLTPEDIQSWSCQPYWKSMNIAEAIMKSSSPQYTHTFFPEQFFHDIGGDEEPQQTILWMARNLEDSVARRVFPGLVSEYIRRFNDGDPKITGYDKMIHFVWGAALTASYGNPASLTIGYVREALDLLMLNTNWDGKADLQAHRDGATFIRSYLSNKKPQETFK